MKVQSFPGSVLFGALGAVALVFAQHVFAPILGSATVLAIYSSALLIVYAALLGASPRRAMRNGVVAALGTGVVLSLASGVEGLAIGLALLLGVIRSGLDASTRTPRALCLEGLLGLGALAFASVLASPGWLGAAAALWGFALVQSLYFLAPGISTSKERSAAVAGDPFDRARERLLILLEEV